MEPGRESNPQPSQWHLRLNQISRTLEANQRTASQVYEIIEGDKANKGDHRLLKQVIRKTPCNLHMSMISSRIKSFRGVREVNLDVRELAISGFYYCGPGDYVRCYACNGGLQDWAPNEDPWERHAGFYNDCLHVNHHKGREYVEDQSRRIMEYSKGIFPTKLLKEKTMPLTCRCCGERANILFINCGHISSCNECHDNLSACPQCKEKTAGRMRVYL
jgi:hypothetical protein